MRRTVYDDDHEAFRASCAAFLAKQVTPHLEEHLENKALPRDFWLAAGREGFLGLGIPEEFGGSAVGDYRFNAVWTEELSKINAALRTTARRDGDGWVVNGSKTFITNGYSADLIVTAVRTDPDKGAHGITLFGIEASDEGFVAMMERLPQERLGAAVSNIAHAQQILVETIQYAKDRQAFGQSIGSLQHNTFLLAELVTSIEVVQAYVDAGPERCARPLRPAVRRLRFHERVPGRSSLARRARDQDLGRIERDPEGAHRSRSGALRLRFQVLAHLVVRV